jgi:hypothetical protein
MSSFGGIGTISETQNEVGLMVFHLVPSAMHACFVPWFLLLVVIQRLKEIFSCKRCTLLALSGVCSVLVMRKLLCEHKGRYPPYFILGHRIGIARLRLSHVILV